MSDAGLFRYRDSVNALLFDYQWIEELLRIVLSAYYEAIRRAKPEGVRFGLNRASLEKDALGTLVKKYSHLSPNEDLVANLKSLVGERNQCAHRSFVLSIEEQNDIQFLEGEVARMVALKVRTKSCVELLHTEFAQFAARFQEPLQATAERGTTNREEDGSGNT
jgi:hypothetical protein